VSVRAFPERINEGGKTTDKKDYNRVFVLDVSGTML
jgi:hypothetical protein